MKETILLKNVVNKYKLSDGQKITKRELQKISTHENIELKDLVFLLGGYKDIIYKDEDCYTKINLYNRVLNDRQVVYLVKLDLKYINSYGSRFYTKEEIIEICNKYAIDLDVFLLYVYKYKICYYGNMDVIENNKEGLWIGERPKFTSTFIS